MELQMTFGYLRRTSLGQKDLLVGEFYRLNPEAPQHIPAAIYATLPFQPLPNFTDPPKCVLFDWMIG
jgi:hypothetical protein